VPIPRFQNIDAATRSAILDAARAEFAERGFEGSSYNRIIANSGLSKSSFYYYFHGKEDLYVTVVNDAISQFAEAIGDPRKVTTVEEFWEEGARLIRRFYEFGMKNLILIGVLMSVLELKSGRLAKDLTAQITLKDIRWYEAIIRLGQALGAVRTDRELDLIVDLELAVLVAWTKWSAKRWLAGKPVDVEDSIDNIIDLLRRMATPAERQGHEATSRNVGTDTSTT
jgi:AcrR family transcriptional regulator